MMQAILVAFPKLAEGRRVKILDAILLTTLNWTRLMDSSDPPLDPVQLKSRILAILDALQANAISFGPVEAMVAMERFLEILDGSTLDIRNLLIDAPSDLCLEEVAREHFAPTLSILTAIKQFNSIKGVQMLESTQRIVEDYFDIIVGYLLGSVSYESFLCTLVQVLLVSLTVSYRLL